jgi:hypothetical protein
MFQKHDTANTALRKLDLYPSSGKTAGVGTIGLAPSTSLPAQQAIHFLKIVCKFFLLAFGAIQGELQMPEAKYFHIVGYIKIDSTFNLHTKLCERLRLIVGLLPWSNYRFR